MFIKLTMGTKRKVLIYLFRLRLGVSTFSCSEIGEKVDDIGAMVIAARGTEVLSETSIEEGIGGDAEGVPVKATTSDTLLCFDSVP